MTKTKQTKKLALSTATLRQLDGELLKQASGGRSDRTCAVSNLTCDLCIGGDFS